MNDEELIARLRDWPYQGETMANAAADRIKALTKERDDYANKLMQANNTYTEMHLEIERLSDKLAQAVALLIEASTDLTAYVDADYPPESCARYPDIARRHHRDLELVRRIDATLAEIKGESHE